MRQAGPFVVLVCVLATGCGSNDPSTSSPRADPTEASTSPTAPSAPASVPPKPSDTNTGNGAATRAKFITADSEFGTMLYDVTGQPIYLFTAESGGRPACYDDCAADWPPVLTSGAPRGTADVSAGLLGTSDRADGTTQVT